jgi:O-succinylhomoserine sulfhydrylase
MEGAEQAVATSSGMSAILATCMALLKSGDRIVCSGSIFGSTVSLFNKYMGKFGVEVVYVSATDVNAWQQAMTKNTRLLFVETPSNPMSDIVDIEALADIAHQNNALLAVDNCFCTCALQKPMELGADIVVYSATKYIDGQGRCMGGAVVGNKKEMDDVLLFLRTAGPTMSPFNAWVFLKGLETLSLRMNAHSSNAMALALWLDEHPAVEKVFYAGLPSSAGHALAKQQQSGFGGVLAFTVKGGQPQAWTVIDNTQLLSLTANLGDVKSTIVHPATTTHGRLTEEERQTMGITDNLIRIAVGLEDIEDIKADLNKGLMLI